MDRLYRTTWVLVDGAFSPATHALWGKWRAVDGRPDPEIAGGLCLVLLRDVDNATHDQVVLLPNTQEITLANIQTLSLSLTGVQLDNFDELMEYAELLTGSANPNYPDKMSLINTFRARKGLGQI